MNPIHHIVGIGASAGGLEALQKLVASLKPDWPMSYVVAQHLSPTHTSMLKELLARETELTVEELVDDRTLAASVVYIIPPNSDAEYADGKITLLSPQHAIGPKPSVDRLFRSLANHLGSRTVGIILSGTGGDGAKGLVAIKDVGGLAIVQEPASAKYSGMPNAALQDARVDYVVAADEIGDVLEAAISGRPYEYPATVDAEDDLHHAVRVVFEKTGLDLSGYKASTLMRRMQRRMNLVKAPSVPAYAELLEHRPDECANFAREVLISVTDFFRDGPAFKALANTLPGILETIGDHREVRIWNPGCATGEETYSLAILLEEAIRRYGKPIRYKIFATDIDVNAVAVGRQGAYHRTACESLSEDWLERYFEPEGGEWVATKSLRSNIVFSVHNLIQDPPFSRIDLISCRNLLIYFNNALQKRILGLFNYSLNANGILFLGRSESIELHKELFLHLDKEARIFRKQQDFGFKPPISISMDVDITGRYIDRRAPRSKKPSQPLISTIGQCALDLYAPPALAINQLDEVVYVLGNVDPFVTMRAGPTALNIFSLIQETFRPELRALIYKCRRERQSASGAHHHLITSDENRTIQITVRPLPPTKELNGSEVLLVAFEPVVRVIRPDSPSNPRDDHEDLDGNLERLDELEHALATTQEHLQTVIQELETSNEELQSLTEELQSANEELQSTNEELQTSNEELQSTNEELLTVNDELEVKSRELESALTDLQNILASTEYPLLVVDRNLRVTRSVPAIERIIDRDSIHHGDVITAVGWKLELNDLRGILKSVIDTGITHQETIRCGDLYYRFMVKPYYLENRQIAGAVLWFPDITDVTQAHLKATASESWLQAVVDSVLVGIITIDQKGIVHAFNATAEQMFGYREPEMLGQPIEKLMPATHAQHHEAYLARYLRTGERKIIGTVRELEALHKNGSIFPIELAVNELNIDGERFFCGVISDNTRRKQAESRLAEEQLRALVTLQSINDAVISVDSADRIQFMNPVAENLTGWSNERAVNRDVREVYHILDEKSRATLTEKLIAQLHSGERSSFHDGITLKHADGSEFCIEQSIAPLLGIDGVPLGAVISFHDITTRRQLLQQMTWQAQHDPLTGLVNRSEFELRITTALASAAGFDRQHALLYLDLDQFKLVNDTCGHHAGDELLRQLASILGATLRARDTLARMGGDEFAVLVENCSLTQAEQIAEKLRELVQEFRFSHDDKVFKIGVSIGVVPITNATQDLATLLSDADAACYAAKETGRNRVQIHSPDDKELEYKRSEMHWVARINKAIDDDRFELYFQRIRPLKGLENCRWEVLLRLLDESNTLIPPGVFLPAAERYGLIQNLDRWVLTRVVSELVKCPPNVRPVVSVNLSASSIVNPKFFNYAGQLIKQNMQIAECICFELTETTAITNFSAAQDFMRTMKRSGCLFALDDFGSGMSSFGYLKNLPVDYLKIDGVFVKDILHDEIDLFMVESIARIGHLMNIKTIAEYAESEAIIDKLAQIGVDYAQGFAVGRPVPLRQFLSELGATKLTTAHGNLTPTAH